MKHAALWLVAVFALGVVLGPVAPARADEDSSSAPWFLPTTWVELIGGAAEAVVKWAGGEVVSVEPGGDPWQEYVYDVIASDSYGMILYGTTFEGLDAKGDPMFRSYVQGTYPGPGGACDWCTQPPNMPSYVDVTLSDGARTFVGLGAGPDGVYRVTRTWGDGRTIVRLSIGWDEWVAAGSPSSLVSGSSKRLPALYQAGESPAVTTTTLLCRTAAGDDLVVEEESAPGAASAPAPVCPAGSVPVRVTITNSVSGVVSDSSITAPDWYLKDPGEYNIVLGAGGRPCYEGVAGCTPEEWAAGSTKECYAAGTREVDWRIVRLASAVCEDVVQAERLPYLEPLEDPESDDVGILQRAIDDAKREIAGQVAQAEYGISQAVERVQKAVGYTNDLLLPNFESLEAKASGAGLELRGLDQWEGAGSGYAAAMSVTCASCEGPEITVMIPGGESWQLNPLSSCEPPLDRLSSALKVGLRALLALGTFLAVVATMAKAIGWIGPDHAASNKTGAKE